MWHAPVEVLDFLRWTVALLSTPVLGLIVAAAVLSPRIAQRARFLGYAVLVFLGASDRLAHLGDDYFTWRLPLYVVGLALGLWGTVSYLLDPGDTNWRHRGHRTAH
jgi:hypothetical protein